LTHRVISVDYYDALRYPAFVSGSPTSASTLVVTRYENRKLYDAAGRRYVTLDELLARVVAGEELEVVDQKTGEDLTTLTLAQILLEGLRRSTAQVPRRMLARLIRLAFGPNPEWDKGDAEGPRAALRGLEQRLDQLDLQVDANRASTRKRSKARPSGRRTGPTGN
jgi:polyhydroxyalkanoate synthesis repressor PhaR